MGRAGDNEVFDFTDIILERVPYRVEWEYIGEGNSGDYDAEDPSDVRLLRFTCSERKWNDDDGEWNWVQLQNGSFCTRMPATSPRWMLVRALGLLLEACEDVPNRKRRFEELSWLQPADFEGKG